MKFKYSLVVEYQNKNMYKMLLMIFSLCIIIGYTELDTFILASVSSNQISRSQRQNEKINGGGHAEFD